MNHLLSGLNKAGVTWTLESVNEVWGTGESPRPGLKVSVAIPGEEPLTQVFSIHTELTLEQLVAVILKKRQPEHPALRDWLDSKGNVPVTLEAVSDCLGYVVHSGLRKLADSKQSIINWHGMHHLNEQDRTAYYAELAELLKQSFDRPKPPLRRTVAKAVQKMTIEFFDNRKYVDLQNAKGRPLERTDLEKFTLHSMYAACSLTDISEWMWGWLGYVLKDIPQEAEPPVAGNETDKFVWEA